MLVQTSICNKSWPTHNTLSQGSAHDICDISDISDICDICDISDICVYPHHLDRRSSFIISTS